jgi:hypothetical protein
MRALLSASTILGHETFRLVVAPLAAATSVATNLRRPRRADDGAAAIPGHVNHSALGIRNQSDAISVGSSRIHCSRQPPIGVAREPYDFLSLR